MQFLPIFEQLLKATPPPDLTNLNTVAEISHKKYGECIAHSPYHLYKLTKKHLKHMSFYSNLKSIEFLISSAAAAICAVNTPGSATHLWAFASK